MMTHCGLLTINKEPVPLKSVEVKVEVRDHVASVVSALNYENGEDKPVEVVFVFPLPGDAAVCHFSATIGQKEIVAEVKEKQQAHVEYDDALSSGQQAFLLEESDESPDIFSLRVGSLPPGQSASIRLEYVIELAVQADDGLRFCLPTVLNPRYQPTDSKASSVQVSSVPAAQVPYTLSLCVQVSSTHPISKVESNCSLEPLEYLNAEKTQATVKLAAGHKFDRDVELLIYYLDAHRPTALVEAGQTSAAPLSLMGDPVVMLSLYPDFAQAALSSFASCGDFVFLLDCSGSMSSPLNRSKMNETRIASARDTLLLLLKSLPMGCFFNIYTFGSSFEHMFPTSVEYTQQNLDVALKKVEKIGASLGGTEIRKPLEHIFSQTCIPGQPRQLFVFTDGEVSNTKEVLSLVKKNSGSHRCFTFGIGEGASTALINGLAREGGGHMQFITGADRMQPKVMQSLKFALQPAVVDLALVWDLPKDASVTVLSPPLVSVFQGQRSLVYARLSGLSSTAAEGHVTLSYSLAGELHQHKLHFSLQPAENNRLTVHRLAARTLIRSLEMEGETDNKNVKEEVVKASVQSGVSSTYTAFVAVNKDAGEVVQGPLRMRHIPAPWAMTYYGSFSGLHGATNLCHMPASSPSNLKRRGGATSKILKFFQGNKPRATRFSAATPQFKALGSCDLQNAVARNVFEAADSDSDCDCDSGAFLFEKPARDPLLQLISLQKASGCWSLDAHLAAALGKTLDELQQAKPEAKSNTEVTDEVWATVLALLWLHHVKLDAQEEWSLLAKKAMSWLQANDASYSATCVDVGNSVLGCKVQKETLGL